MTSVTKLFFHSTTSTIFIKKISNMSVNGVTNSYIKDSEPSNKVKLRFYMYSIHDPVLRNLLNYIPYLDMVISKYSF